MVIQLANIENNVILTLPIIHLVINTLLFLYVQSVNKQYFKHKDTNTSENYFLSCKKTQCTEELDTPYTSEYVLSKSNHITIQLFDEINAFYEPQISRLRNMSHKHKYYVEIEFENFAAMSDHIDFIKNMEQDITFDENDVFTINKWKYHFHI